MPAPFYRNFRFSSQQPDTIRPFGDSNASFFSFAGRRIATMTASQTRVLLRFQKAAVRGNYGTGNQAFSMRLRFLTTRPSLIYHAAYPHGWLVHIELLIRVLLQHTDR